MSTEPRRAKSNSVTAAVGAFRSANQSIPWPTTVSQLLNPADAARALDIFAGIIAGRDLRDWHRPNDVTLAAQLANVMAQADRLSQEIEAEGWTIPSPKNPIQMIRNSKLDALTLISSRQLSLTRALALNGPPSDRKTVSNNARAAASARAIVDRDGDDVASLLA